MLKTVMLLNMFVETIDQRNTSLLNKMYLFYSS